MGRDRQQPADDGSIRGFNPRARVGRDHIEKRSAPPISGFNPRARVGRDGYRWLAARKPDCFNPRARVGRDMLLTEWFGNGYVAFQSTRPRGARLSAD